MGAIAAHLVEILLFTLGLIYFDNSPEYGSVGGTSPDGTMDYFYFSAVTFTSLGYGDITPNGLIRILAAVEASLRVVSELLDDPRTDEFVADLLRENIRQIRVAVAEKHPEVQPPPAP